MRHTYIIPTDEVVPNAPELDGKSSAYGTGDPPVAIGLADEIGHAIPIDIGNLYVQSSIGDYDGDGKPDIAGNTSTEWWGSQLCQRTLGLLVNRHRLGRCLRCCVFVIESEAS